MRILVVVMFINIALFGVLELLVYDSNSIWEKMAAYMSIFWMVLKPTNFSYDFVFLHFV